MEMARRWASCCGGAKSRTPRPAAWPAAGDLRGGTQGGIGYQIQQTLKNEFLRRGLCEDSIAVLTQVVVDKDDRFSGIPRSPWANSTRPSGPRSSAAKTPRGCSGKTPGAASGVTYPSPRPLEIVEEAGLKTLLASGLHLIAGGGGGIPVFRTEGGYEGVDAVVDKDLTSCLLAKRIKSDLFVISTAVSNVAIHFGTPEQENISRMTVAEAMACVEAGYFARAVCFPRSWRRWTSSGQPARRPSSPRRKTSAPRSWKARGRISSPDRCPIFREDGCLPRLARLGNAPEGFMRRKTARGCGRGLIRYDKPK